MKPPCCLVTCLLTVGILAQAGCGKRPTASSVAHPFYLVGPAWMSADHAWFYPRERLAGSMTGLATDEPPCGSDRITADGETCDATIPEAAVQTLQLPVILRVTNLENGLRILVRANDRGPSSPARLIALDRRAGALLAIEPGRPTRVRLDIDPGLSEAVTVGLAGVPRLDVSVAPQQAVEERPLDGRTGRDSDIGRVGGGSDPLGPRGRPDIDAILRNQPVSREPVRPTRLWVDIGVFSAQPIASSIAALAGGTVEIEGSTHPDFAVRAGPFRTVSEADAALNRARVGGITGARIVVE